MRVIEFLNGINWADIIEESIDKYDISTWIEERLGAGNVPVTYMRILIYDLDKEKFLANREIRSEIELRAIIKEITNRLTEQV